MPSIFDPPATKAPAFGLFGAPTTSAPTAQPSQPSLFSSQGTTLTGNSQSNPSTSGGLFGALPTSIAPATQTTSMFGNLIPASSAPAAQTSSLFGTAPAVKGSLFGAAPASSAPVPQPSIFGSTTASAQAAGGPSTQGQQQNAAPEPNTAIHAGYFNGLLEKGKKRSNPSDADSKFGEVPSLQLGLGDLAKRVKQLGPGEPQGRQSRLGDSKAHYLLAASGVKPGATLRDLNSFDPKSSRPAPALKEMAPETEAWDPDSHKYVQQLQQRATLKMQAEAIARTQRNFDQFLADRITIDRDAQRKRIYEHFGLVPRGSDQTPGSSFLNPGGKGSFGKSTRNGKGPGNMSFQGSLGRSVFGASGMQKPVIGSPHTGAGNATLFTDEEDKIQSSSPINEDRSLREKRARFTEKVQTLNVARLEEKVCPLLHEFSSVESQPGSDSTNYIANAYKALIEIAKETSDAYSHGDPGALKERQYSKYYLDDSPNSQKSFQIRKQILEGSRRALEKAFFASLETLITKFPREANVGGVPTVINKVRAYIRLRNSRRDLASDKVMLQELEGDYCWALIFYLLRSGLVNEAATYVTDNVQAFNALDRTFVTFITTYAKSPDRRLGRQLQDRINVEYRQRNRNALEGTLDPYRMACYKVVGRCDVAVASLPGISLGVEDWAWLQFALAREVNRVEEVASEVFGLEGVQENIREIGRRHFQKGSDAPGGYGVFFYFQILGGLFEQAISYLYSHNYVSAVHFAIALDYYGFLRVSDFQAANSELLTYTTREQPQVNFARMVGFYTRDFRTANPEAAVDYLSLFCLNADLPGALGKTQTALCHEALRELVLESRDFAQLLGDVQPDGKRIRGAIERRLPILGLADQADFLRTVTVQAASIADDNGRITDAVLLYHLADDYDNVISVVNRALSDAIAVELGQESLRLQPLKPRSEVQKQGDAVQAGSTLSLAAIEDPVVLAQEIVRIYNGQAMYFEKIRQATKDACSILLKLAELRDKIQREDWVGALDVIVPLNLLPLQAKSSIPAIRSAAQTLSTLPPTISRLIGPVLLWTMEAIGRQREVLLNGSDGGQEKGTFDNEMRKRMREDLVVMAKDLMVFAGLVKLRLGKGVWEGLVGGAGEVGVY